MRDNLTNEIDRKTYKYKKSTIINKNSDKPKASKNRHYVDGEAFYQALVERRAAKEKAAAEGKEPPRVTEFIGKCIMDICNNLSRKFQFANYPFRDEMVADAIVHCLRYIDSFDPTKSTNAFSYYTQTAYYQFLSRIREEKCQTYIKCKATMNSMVMSELSEMEGEMSDMAEHIHDNMEFDTEFMEKYVNDFESKLVKQKTAAKPRGLDLLCEDEPNEQED